MDNAVGGLFAVNQVVVAWSLEEEDCGNGCVEWVLEVKFGDVGVTRRFPSNLTREEAEAEAQEILPELFLIAGTWLKKRPAANVSR